MIKLNYRILKIEFLEAKNIFIAQYQIFGIWMNIGLTKNYFTKCTPTWCDTKDEAIGRIKKYMINMERSSDWGFKRITKIHTGQKQS
jgi:hypothetical protein